MDKVRVDKMKDSADSILEHAAKATTNPSVLRWLIQNNVHSEAAEMRISEILEGDEEDTGPSILQIETAKTVISLLLDPKEQEEMLRSQEQRWLVGGDNAEL